MAKTVIQVENLSKQYRLGLVGTGTLQHDLNRWWHKIRGLEDPYLKVTDSNDRSKSGSSEYVWALRDISFKVNEGEVYGIIGKNGAGKSTLLKLLSRVTGPSTGKISIKGRISSLLEVGTAFHPELTGRENVYLNGAIHGMDRREVSQKLDEIINFSGCERYIDTPVKRYSSGMTVRLGFAVAAHLEPDILVIDEVLAVGDAEFQKKCIGKMKDVAGHGRTVLFVSHNMASVKSLCNRGILMQNGRITHENEISEIVSHYLSLNISDNISINQASFDPLHKYPIELKQILVYNTLNKSPAIKTGDPVTVSIDLYNTLGTEASTSIDITLIIKHEDIPVTTLSTRFVDSLSSVNSLTHRIQCQVSNLGLLPGEYTVFVWLGVNGETVNRVESAMKLVVERDQTSWARIQPSISKYGPHVIDQQWQL